VDYYWISFVVISIKKIVIVLARKIITLFHSDFSNETSICGEFSQKFLCRRGRGMLEVTPGQKVVKRLNSTSLMDNSLLEFRILHL
jgi:hypothetical protein